MILKNQITPQYIFEVLFLFQNIVVEVTFIYITYMIIISYLIYELIGQHMIWTGK